MGWHYNYNLDILEECSKNSFEISRNFRSSKHFESKEECLKNVKIANLNVLLSSTFEKRRRILLNQMAEEYRDDFFSGLLEENEYFLLSRFSKTQLTSDCLILDLKNIVSEESTFVEFANDPFSYLMFNPSVPMKRLSEAGEAFLQFSYPIVVSLDGELFSPADIYMFPITNDYSEDEYEPLDINLLLTDEEYFDIEMIERGFPLWKD